MLDLFKRNTLFRYTGCLFPITYFGWLLINHKKKRNDQLVLQVVSVFMFILLRPFFVCFVLFKDNRVRLRRSLEIKLLTNVQSHVALRPPLAFIGSK